jgi:hypothetical protein
MPIAKWSGSSKGLISFEGGIFKLEFKVDRDDEEILYNWTKEICEYRLIWHFDRNGNLSKNRKL